jgi:hypothetical protein
LVASERKEQLGELDAMVGDQVRRVEGLGEVEEVLEHVLEGK